MREIRCLARRIAEKFSPRKVVLFGSRACGTPAAGSDVDLLVVTDVRPQPDASLAIRRAVDYSFPLDIVVIDEATLKERIEDGDYFLSDAVSRGKVLYEAIDS